MAKNEFTAEIKYPDCKKTVVYCFSTVHQLGKFLRCCIGDLDQKEHIDGFRLSADQADRRSKATTWTIRYGFTPGTAALIVDLHSYYHIVKHATYKIIVNGVTHLWRPELTLTLKRAR